MPTFAERLRELRTRAGLTQAELAQASRVPLGSIRNYEQGMREPYWDVVFRLARGVGVSVERFADCLPTAAPDATEPRRRRSSRPALSRSRR